MIGYILASCWAIGLFAGLAVLAYWMLDEGGVVGTALLLLIGLPVTCLLASLPFMVIDQGKSPNLVTLKKNEWACTASHQQITTMIIPVGKVMVPQVHTSQICDTYGRVK